MPRKELTDKQRAAIDAHLSGMGKMAAVRAAGYSCPESDCDRVFNSPLVKAEIEQRRVTIRQDADIKIQDVLDGLMQAVHAAENTADLVMAWREIGRIIGAYEHAKRIEVDIKHEHIQNVKQLERLSDKELAQLADLGEDFVIDGEYEEVK